MRLQLRSGRGRVHKPENLSRGIENCTLIFRRSSVMNREYGTRPCLRVSPAETIFPQAAFAPFSQSHRVFQLTYTMTDEDERELETELARLQQEHRDLDAAIDALHQAPAPARLRLHPRPKRNLPLRPPPPFTPPPTPPDT